MLLRASCCSSSSSGRTGWKNRLSLKPLFSIKIVLIKSNQIQMSVSLSLTVQAIVYIFQAEDWKQERDLYQFLLQAVFNNFIFARGLKLFEENSGRGIQCQQPKFMKQCSSCCKGDGQLFLLFFFLITF
jgi:hypothetical protein